MTDKPASMSKQEIIAIIEDLLAKAERGEPVTATLRLQTMDGEWHEIVLGGQSDEDQDAALAKLLRVLGRLH